METVERPLDIVGVVSIYELDKHYLEVCADIAASIPFGRPEERCRLCPSWQYRIAMVSTLRTVCGLP